MSEDLILVPRRYVASACHALANGKNADNTVAGLREYSLGKSVEADAQSQLAALREELAAIKESTSYRGSLLGRTEQRLADAERRNSELEAEIERRKDYSSSWEKTAGNMCKSRAEALKKVAEGYTVSVFKAPAPVDALDQLAPCEVFQLGDELLVLHAAIILNPNPEAASHD